MGDLSIARAQWRVLTLRFDEIDLAKLGPRHLFYGLLVTWAVGLGRYWDHPEPYLLQALGLGSLAVAGVLGLFLFLVLWPLKPANWSLIHLYTFISLTSLPALLYAIPVEQFLELEAARTANVWFLGTVAAWRVAMLGRYLLKQASLPAPLAFVALLLPLALIIACLVILNLEKAVFNIMAGLDEKAGTANDEAYLVLFILSAFSFWASPILLGLYAFAVWSRWRRPDREA
jgi:hypothetical protein